MKKIIKFLSIGLLTCSLVGCSCNKDEIVESVLNNPTQVISGSKTNITLSTQDIYSYVRTNDTESVNKAFLTYLIEQILDLSSSSSKTATYNLKIKDYFQENFLDSDTYKINGVFNEDLLAAELEEQLYVIDKVNQPSSGPTVELNLKYDYSDYIKRNLNYTLYMEMLKEDYILTQRSSLFENSKTRIISVFSSDDLEEMETIVDDLFAGKYQSLQEVAETKKQEEREEIGRQFCVNLGLEDGSYYEGICTPSTSSSTYDSALYKFTVCANGLRCTPSQGLEYQIGLINDAEYVSERIVNKETSGILYEQALSQLLREDVEEHLKEVIVGKDKFLINGLYNSDDTFNNRDIILSEGPNSTYYLVTVRVIDEDTTDIKDKERALSLLLDKVSDTTVLSHYLDSLNVEVEDPQLKEYYDSLIGTN